MKVVSVTAMTELKQLHSEGFTSRLAQSSSDGSDVIIAENTQGLIRMFSVYELEDKYGLDNNR